MTIININRKRGGLCFWENDTLIYYGRNRRFNLFGNVSYLLNSSDEILATNKSNVWFGLKTKLTIYGKNYWIRWHNIIYKPNYTIEIEGNQYLFIIHRKEFTSIFKNEEQIGHIKDESKFYLGNNETFELKLLPNENKEIICALINNNIIPIFDNNEMINFNISKSISEIKPFNHQWEKI